MSETDRLAQEIRRVDGAHTMGAGALAEALGPFIEAVRAEEREKAAQIAESEIPEMGSHILETDYRRGKAVTASDIAARIRNQEVGQ